MARRRSSFSTLFAISPVALVRKMSSATDGCPDPAHRRSAYMPSPSGSPHRSRLYQSQRTSAGRPPACSSGVLAAVRSNGCSDKVAASAKPHCRQSPFRPSERILRAAWAFRKGSLARLTSPSPALPYLRFTLLDRAGRVPDLVAILTAAWRQGWPGEASARGDPAPVGCKTPPPLPFANLGLIRLFDIQPRRGRLTQTCRPRGFGKNPNARG